MSSDEKFDAWLRDAAQDYHRAPSAAPRDAMWVAIAARARGADLTRRHENEAIERSAQLVHGRAIANRTPNTSRRPAWSPRWWQYAAALVLLAAGIGIGRTWSGREPSTPAPLASAPDAHSNPGPATTTVIYDVATVQHLSRAEALLTSFRATDGNESPASIDRWARDLLGDTRLLLDSPAADDQRRRLLLEDLELVLAQIVQLPTESSVDRTLVRRSIERGEVLSRIRSTIPAGTTSGT